MNLMTLNNTKIKQIRKMNKIYLKKEQISNIQVKIK